MNVVLTRVNPIKTRPQNLHRGCRVIQSVLMNIGWLKTAVSARLLRQKFKLRKGEMKFTTTARKLSVKATPEPLDAVAVPNTAARPSSTVYQFCRADYGYRSTCAAHTTSASSRFSVRFIKAVFDNRPITKLPADRNQGVSIFTRFMSLTSARWMFGSGKTVKSPNNFSPAYATKTASAKRSLSINDGQVITDKGQTTDYFSDWKSFRLGLAIHADLRRQVVFHLALQG